ncbi:phospholipase D family protein [Halomarina pelagica]|uniref:phospholipase D family protein n=1 Tax=Halomarina pelagica TaxID=2961599 RepID=UPI0020C498D0|nr:phospholipase D family protein [Halomarina sp. BND7]
MLEPQDRSLLHETLRPPAGYDLDYAVGATYSLDLTALLAVPLAFTRHQQVGTEPEDFDPVAILDALRKNSENMTLFCQAGGIHVPSQQHPLYQLLEDLVVETTTPSGSGSFHPKTWVLRYTAPDSPVHYRFLCLSRNLTYARSWDTVLTLDGKLTDREYAYTRNHPLGDFIEALPNMAVRELGDERQERIATIQDEIRRVDFDPPDPFEEIAFHPFGIDSRDQWPFPDRSTDLVVVSPFLSRSLLSQLNPESRHATLISRWEELESLTETALEPWDEVFTLSRAAELDEQSDDLEMPSEDADESTLEDDEDALRSLHAKLFLVDDGWDARVYTGSANATRAAFTDNVEFLVELRGKKSKCGTGVLLGQKDSEMSLRDLLEPFQYDGTTSPDPIAEKLEKELRDIKQAVASSQISAFVEQSTEGEEYVFTLRTDGTSLSLPHKASLTARPISLQDRAATDVTLDSPELATFTLSYEAITSFIAFEATAEAASKTQSETFVLNIPLENAPTDRRQRLLRTIVNDRRRFLQFLALLLGDTDTTFGYLLSQTNWKDWDGTSRNGELEQFPLLEQLLRVLYQNPEQLDRVHELMTDLEAVSDEESVLPDGFTSVFDPIWAVKSGGEQ